MVVLLTLSLPFVFQLFFFSFFCSLFVGSGGKESACHAGDLGLICGSERSPGEGNGNPLQYSCLENSMDRGARQTEELVMGVARSPTRLSN